MAPQTADVTLLDILSEKAPGVTVRLICKDRGKPTRCWETNKEISMAREKGMGNLQREKSGHWTMRVGIDGKRYCRPTRTYGALGWSCCRN